jgi:hypothetical protein
MEVCNGIRVSGCVEIHNVNHDKVNGVPVSVHTWQYLKKNYYYLMYIKSKLKDMTLILNVLLPFGIKIEILKNMFLLIYRGGRRFKRSE